MVKDFAYGTVYVMRAWHLNLFSKARVKDFAYGAVYVMISYYKAYHKRCSNTSIVCDVFF